MNKQELINKIANDADITKSQAKIALDSLTEIISKVLKEGGKFNLVGLGSFSVSKTVFKNGRNPQTGTVVKIKTSKVVKFKAVKAISMLLGDPDGL